MYVHYDNLKEMLDFYQDELNIDEEFYIKIIEHLRGNDQREHGKILYFLAKKHKARNIYDAGTARGFSAVIMAKAIQDNDLTGKVYTYDNIPNDKKIAWHAKKQPEKKIRAGPIAVAIWRNITNDGMRSFYSITFEKRFKDKEREEWRSTNALSKNDIPKAMIALQEAYKFLVLHKSPQEIIEEALDDNIELPKENYFEDEFEKELEGKDKETKDEEEDEDNSEEEE